MITDDEFKKLREIWIERPDKNTVKAYLAALKSEKKSLFRIKRLVSWIDESSVNTSAPTCGEQEGEAYRNHQSFAYIELPSIDGKIDFSRLDEKSIYLWADNNQEVFDRWWSTQGMTTEYKAEAMLITHMGLPAEPECPEDIYT